MRLLFDRVAGVVWTVFAAFTIVFAILISLLRIALPAVDQQRPAIESWLSEFIGLPLVIGEVDASWRGWMPTIQVEELVLMDAGGINELVRFDSAEVDISPSDSLRHLSLQPRRLIVRGMRIALERDLEGRISIAGMPPSRWPVAQWILQQENFTLTDADVSFTDRSTGGPTAVFNNVVLSVSRDAEYQLIQGRLQRQDSGGGDYDFALHADGDVLGDDWAGKLFVEVNNADPRSILALAGTRLGSEVGGRLHARIWSTWEAAAMQRAALEINGTLTQDTAPGAASTADLRASGLALRLVDGWAFEFDRLLVAFLDEPAAESRLAVRWRTRDDAAPFIGFSGENVSLRHLTRFVNANDDAGKLVPAGVRGVATEGVFTEIAGAIQRGTTTTPRYYLEGKISDLAVAGTPRWPRVSGLDFSFRMNKQGGAGRTASTGGITIAGETFLAAPIEIEELAGAVSWSLAPEEVLIQTEALEIQAESFDFTVGGSLSLRSSAGPHMNLVTEINSGDLVRLGSLIPLNTLPPRGDAWLRTAFKAGHFAPSRIVFRGPLSDFPFDSGNGMVAGNFEVRGVDLKYGANWPMATAIDATISVENRHAKTLVHEGRVYSAEIGGSTIEMPDLFSRKPVVRIRGKTRVVPLELGNFIAASPLGKTKAQRYSEIAITNDFDMTLDINLNLYPGGESDVLGLVHFSGNRISHGLQEITLEDVRGDISFTRQDWYGEGLTATFAGDRVGVVLNGGLDDPNYDTEFRMTGSSDAAQLQRYIERYAPQLGALLKSGADQQPLDGKLPWKAVMTIPEASRDGKKAPKRLSVESSLMGLTVDLPWPFGKTSAEQKPLTLTTTTDAGGDRLVRVSYGDTVAAEFDQAKRADGGFTTRRAEFVFGDPAPIFSGDPGLLARGRIGRLPLNDWVKFARTATAAMDGARTGLPVRVDVLVERLEAFGHTFKGTKLTGTKDTTAWKLSLTGPQVLGTVTFPHGSPNPMLLLDFERLWLRKSTTVGTASNMDPSQIPSLRFSAGSLHFNDIDLGRATLVASQERQGLNIEQLKLSQENFELSGHGTWQLAGEVHQSQVALKVNGDSLAGLLESFNYSVANIDGGKTDIEITAAWGGTPSEFRLDKLHGQFTLEVAEGRFLDIEPGGGRLFGLLSLQTLPRRLSFDFNDLFSKGFAFDTIEGTFELDSGNAYTNSLLMNGPSARINVSGRTGLKDQDYDQLVTVTPALSSTIPVASALFGPAGIGVGAVIYLGQKMFKSIPEQVDKFLSREYSITGAWKQPVIERI